MAAVIKNELGTDVELSPGRRGSFEISKNGKTVYSRLDTGLFPANDEVIELLEDAGG